MDAPSRGRAAQAHSTKTGVRCCGGCRGPHELPEGVQRNLRLVWLKDGVDTRSVELCVCRKSFMETQVFLLDTFGELVLLLSICWCVLRLILGMPLGHLSN